MAPLQRVYAFGGIKKKVALFEQLSFFIVEFILQDAVFRHFDDLQLAFVLAFPLTYE